MSGFPIKKTLDDFDFAFYKHSDIDDVIVIWRGDACGAINRAGEEVIPLIYQGIHGFCGGVSVAVDANGKFGLIGKGGEVLFPFGKYDTIRPGDGAVVVRDSEGEYAALDAHENIIVPFGRYLFTHSTMAMLP